MDKKVFKTLIWSLIGLIILTFLLWHIEIPIEFFKKIFTVIRPIVIGGAIAFTLNKPMCRIQRIYNWVFHKLNKRKKNYEPNQKAVGVLSLISVYLMFFAIITIIICFIIPQITDSVEFFASSFGTYYANFMNFLNKIDLSFLEDPSIIEKVNEIAKKITEQLPDVIMKTFGVTANIINIIVDSVVGFIFSVYVLAGKKKIKSQTSRVFRSIFSDKIYRKILEYYRLISDTFGNFINGQLTEAAILGILCFIGMQIFGFEYSVLISVIIGITNIIPIFGPIIGTIPGVLILLFVNPVHALWFVVFIIVLQQIESNLIYPRVVGNSVGLPPMWTLIAITMGGGLFGLWGMILGVPCMSIIYATVRDLTTTILKKKRQKAHSSSSIE